MSRGEMRSEGEKTQKHNESMEKERQKTTQTVSKKKSGRERVYSTHLWGGLAGTTRASTEQRNEHRCRGVSTGLCLINWEFARWSTSYCTRTIGPSLHSSGLCSYCAVDQKMALVMLSGVIWWLRTCLVQPKQEVITSGILSRIFWTY